jgi:prepilin-type N-terminal cleavage/methylation domain-containing protein
MRSRGFTVLELLVAIGILSIMIAGLTIAFIQQQRQFSFTREAVDIDQTARATLDYIATEIRNAVSRQGKTFSIKFVNGGSGVNPPCSDNTDVPGTATSPPDCITLYTWDITRGQNNGNLPSVATTVEVISGGPQLILRLPDEWVVGGEPIVEPGDYIGFRSRINMCNPSGSVNCLSDPELCTECGAILEISSVNKDLRQITINNDMGLIKEQNFQEEDFSSFEEFLSSFFIPEISSQVSEMTVVQSKTFRVDMENMELEMSQNGGPFQPIAGGVDAPGIVDIQFVFNLQDPDGGITKVGVPLDEANRMYPDFSSDPSLLGREKDIRTVEIYLVVRSRVSSQLISGQQIPTQTIPQIGDVLQRQSSSLGEGFIYRVFSTTVYVRNMAREEFG